MGLLWVWPLPVGWLATPAERVLAPLWAAPWALLVGLVVGLGGGRSRASAVGAALMPTLLVLVLAGLPLAGKVYLRVPAWMLGLVVLGALGVLAGLRTRRGPAVVAFVAVLAVLQGVRLGASAMPESPPLVAVTGPRPDVLLITLDTVRADHFDFIGGPDLAETPALSAFAQDARVFRQAYSPIALTGPAHASLMSGLNPFQHGIVANGRPVPSHVPWLPSVLHEHGFESWAWVSAIVLKAGLGYGRGFDHYDDQMDSRGALLHPLLRFVPHPRGGAGFQRSGDTLVRQAIDGGIPDLQLPSDRPRFVWVHVYDAHWPYEGRAVGPDGVPLLDGVAQLPLPIFVGDADAMAPDVVMRLQHAYRDQFAGMDAAVGRVLERVGDDDVVVVVGDHGESLGEHGLLFGHGRSTFAPDTRVPLLIRAPGLDAGQEDHIVSTEDLAPTILKILNIDIPEGMPDNDLRHPDPDRVAVAVASREVFPSPGPVDLGPWASIGVRGGGRSVVADRHNPIGMYELAADPSELAPGPVAPGELKAAWDRTREGVPPAKGRAVDAETARALRALGYLE